RGHAGRRDPAAGAPLRDGPADPLLPAQGGRAAGSARPDRNRDTLPVQGGRLVLLGGGWPDGGPGHRVVLPAPDPGVQQDREPRLLLQRARRRALRRRRAPEETTDSVVAAGAGRPPGFMRRFPTVRLETPTSTAC